MIMLKKDHVARMQSRSEATQVLVQPQGSPMNFDDALKQGLVEFLDVEEEETAMIAMHIADLHKREHGGKCQTYTHCEIHPSMILGVCASIIPFPDHNQVIISYLNLSIVSKKHLSECYG